VTNEVSRFDFSASVSFAGEADSLLLSSPPLSDPELDDAELFDSSGFSLLFLSLS